MNVIKNLSITTAGAVVLALGIVGKADAATLSYSITDLGSTNYNSFNSFDYLGNLAVGGKTYNATSYLRGDEYIYYNDGTKDYLGSFDPSPGFYPTRALAINDKNQVAGNSGYFEVFSWSKDKGIVGLGSPQTGVPIPGTHGYSMAADINNLGQVVGSVGAPDAGWTGFIWNPDGSGLSIGFLPGFTMSDLGLGGTFAAAINDQGQVVGAQDNSNISQSVAILYNEGTLYNLNSLIPANSGWTLEEALDINNQGQIVGTGLFNGEERTFLATPISNTTGVPEPSTVLGTLVFGAVSASSLLKRKRHNKQ